MRAPAAVSAQAWCTFRLAGGHYGVELARVQEVLRPLPVTRLPYPALPPGARPPAIAGLINLRGRIVAVVDLRVALGVEPAPGAAGGFVVVLGAEGPVALLVDAIGDVRRAEGSESPPPSLPAESHHDDGTSPIARTLALPGELLAVLDLDRVLVRAFTATEARA